LVTLKIDQGGDTAVKKREDSIVHVNYN